MKSIEAAAPARDGVCSFVRLYADVTVDVQAELAGQTFADPGFLGGLDVTFANLFFTALGDFQHDPAATPRAWVPLFEARDRKGIAPLQFALAGMNAHIIRDLPVALVATCRANGADLSTLSPEHRDFEQIDKLLAAIEQKLKGTFLTGWLAVADRLVHRFGGSTTSSRCGTSGGPATPRGRTPRPSGRCSPNRSSRPTTSAPSIAWSASRVAPFSCPRAPCSTTRPRDLAPPRRPVARPGLPTSPTGPPAAVE